MIDFVPFRRKIINFLEIERFDRKFWILRIWHNFQIRRANSKILTMEPVSEPQNQQTLQKR